jgi:predicted enzyme related to lactoylglutathione lyase
VFGWDIRGRETSRPRFAYRSADITGAWVAGRAISREAGVLLYIWVDDIDDTLARIETHGGDVAEAPHRVSGANERIATFRDPAGNLMGLYQEGQP